MIKRVIHIWDLQHNKTYIKLKEPYRNNFFIEAYKKAGDWNKLGEILNVKRPDTLLAGNWKRGLCSFPLETALKICKFIKSSKYELEKNISEIRYKERLNKRGGNSGKPLKNPKFPIQVDKRLIEIIGHICGDGSIPRSKQRTDRPLCYINSQVELIENFKGLITNVFGDIEPKTTKRSGWNYRRPNYYLRYPTILSMIILKVFKGKQEPLEFPFYLLKTNENKVSFLKAIYDDEGCIKTKQKQITLVMKSKNFVTGCKKNLKELGIDSGKVTKEKNKEIFRICIANQESIKRFEELIKLDHPKKRKHMEEIITMGWKFKRYKNNLAKKTIITLLNNNDMKMDEIKKRLKRKPTTVKWHLNKLKKEGLINFYPDPIKKNTKEIDRIWHIS